MAPEGQDEGTGRGTGSSCYKQIRGNPEEDTKWVHQAGFAHVSLRLRKEALAGEMNLLAAGAGVAFKTTGQGEIVQGECGWRTGPGQSHMEPQHLESFIAED